MSFGWSAGDIVAALTLTYNLIQALDSVDGAAGHYREAVGFLRDLKRVLEPLRTFSAWDVYPTYRKDIEEQVEYIKEPVDKFLKAILNVEFDEEHQVSHTRNRYTAAAVDTEQLPEKLRRAFEEVLKPEFVSLYRHRLESQQTLGTAITGNFKEIQKESQNTIVSKMTECYDRLWSDINTIKRHLDDSSITQQRIETALSGVSYSPKMKPLSSSSTPGCDDEAPCLPTGRRLGPNDRRVRRGVPGIARQKESLQELSSCLFVPRTLPKESVVLKAFISHEFKDLPGSSWVKQGRYHLQSTLNNRTLNAKNWGVSVAPGATVTMSMILHKVLESLSDIKVNCPERTCPGTWPRPKIASWTTCPICQKEIYTSGDDHPSIDYDPNPQYIKFAEQWDLEEESRPKAKVQARALNHGPVSGPEKSATSTTHDAPNSDSESNAKKLKSRPKSTKSKSRKATKPTADDDVFSFRRITELVGDLHWVEAIFRGPCQFTQTLIRHIGRPRSVCYGPEIAKFNLTGLHSSWRVLVQLSFDQDQIALKFYQHPRVSGVVYLECRYKSQDRSRKALCLFHSLFLVLKARCPLKSPFQESSYDTDDETQLFSEKIAVDGIGEADFVVLRDDQCGGLQLRAEQPFGKESIPLWVAFITARPSTQQYIVQVDASHRTVLLQYVRAYFFDSKCESQQHQTRDEKLEIQFLKVGAAKAFTRLLALDLRSKWGETDEAARLDREFNSGDIPAQDRDDHELETADMNDSESLESDLESDSMSDDIYDDSASKLNDTSEVQENALRIWNSDSEDTFDKFDEDSESDSYESDSESASDSKSTSDLREKNARRERDSDFNAHSENIPDERNEDSEYESDDMGGFWQRSASRAHVRIRRSTRSIQVSKGDILLR
ncbi:uncharacterized protein PAC_12933 [Phialocephala subalpina]|uniref:Fungal N-terminal domain-containing protein n=1 Tax=Phialocephala subalpina TaxID=576137 RepID=A0A1L7XDH0_9HELO|nr:uncharacterized protein PAC_12933 [Phialocephala subalpina]